MRNSHNNGHRVASCPVFNPTAVETQIWTDETMSADVSTEYRLLEIYHESRKSRSREKSKHIRVLPGCSPTDQQARFEASTPTRKRVPASAKPDPFAQVADKLSHIVDSGTQDQALTDSDVIQKLVEILKGFGDQLNEKIEKDEELLRSLQGFSYKVFAKLASAFIHSMVPLGKQTEYNNDQKTKIAWTFEMTSRLCTLDLQPMNRVMGFGAQYVQQHFAPWIQQHGGWENAFIDEGDEVH